MQNESHVMETMRDEDEIVVCIKCKKTFLTPKSFQLHYRKTGHRQYREYKHIGWFHLSKRKDGEKNGEENQIGL